MLLPIPVRSVGIRVSLLAGLLAAGISSSTVAQAAVADLGPKRVLIIGDLMTLTFDIKAKQIRRLDVSSAIEKDPVTLAVVFQNLPDAANYAALSTLNAVAKEIVVTFADRNHVKAAQ